MSGTDRRREGSVLSARQVVPIIIELVGPRSVVDVGCGSGAWLSVFMEHGIDDVVGIEKEVDCPLIPKGVCITHDLQEPFATVRQFDLVLSLEVAEHLPQQSADTFIDTLCSLGNVIVFSAAVPSQGGFEHLNEQWPEYWIDLFKKRGFVAIDCIRDRIWTDENVRFWYAQNMFMFVHNDMLAKDARLKGLLAQNKNKPVSVIHPGLYYGKVANDMRDMPISQIIHNVIKGRM
jgi:SAM-dependent methyltransferase